MQAVEEELHPTGWTEASCLAAPGHSLSAVAVVVGSRNWPAAETQERFSPMGGKKLQPGAADNFLALSAQPH